jgi:hypothetical protein
MNQPLDYFTPRRPGEQDPTPTAPRDAHAAAIPIEFDSLLLHTSDHPAVRAIEAELNRHGIRFFRSEGGGATERGVELHVRSADHAHAAQLAGMIFARRKRLDQISPRRKPIDSILPNHIDVGGGFPGVP